MESLKFRKLDETMPFQGRWKLIKSTLSSSTFHLMFKLSPTSVEFRKGLQKVVKEFPTWRLREEERVNHIRWEEVCPQKSEALGIKDVNVSIKMPRGNGIRGLMPV